MNGRPAGVTTDRAPPRSRTKGERSVSPESLSGHSQNAAIALIHGLCGQKLKLLRQGSASAVGLV